MKKNIQRTFLSISAVCLTAAGCADISEPTTPVISPSEVLAELQISSQSIMIKRGDSIRMSVKAIAIDGSEIPVPDESTVRWSSTDPEQVRVDTNGYVHAVRSSEIPINLVATYQYGLTTKSDTIPVYVTDNSFDITSIRLVALDSQSVGPASSYGTPALPRVRIDVYEGEELRIKGARLHVEVPHPVRLTFNISGGDDNEPVYYVVNEGPYIGKFAVRSSGNVYGVEISDSLIFTGTYAMVLSNPFGIGYNPDTETFITGYEYEYTPFLQPCGIVTFAAISLPIPIDIVFDDSTNVGNCDLSINILPGVEFPDAGEGNFYNLPANSFNLLTRKSSTIGKVTWHARHAITKEPLHVGGSYIAKAPE